MGLRLMREELGAAWDDPNANPADGETPAQELLRLSVQGQDISKNTSSVLCMTQDILDNAESAVDVLNDLLNYDKVEMGTLTLDLGIISIWRAVEQMVHEFEVPASSKNINLRIDYSALVDGISSDIESAMCADKLPRDVLERRVVGDFIRVTQVMRNLISNALKFTPDGGDIRVSMDWVRPTGASDEQVHEFSLGGGEIIVSFARSGHVEIKVGDSGAGMTHEQLAQLFHAGVQFNVNQLQAGQGSGLGLYITKGLVEQHDGTLAASSKGLGKGTTFRVTFPLYFVPDDVLPGGFKHLRISKPIPSSKSGNVPATGNRVRFESLRLLVVDDAMSNRKLLTRLLERRGHQVDEAKDGLEAVNKVKATMESDTPYDSILMDYEMPVMDGPTATKEIRDLKCDAFMVGITGNVLPDDIAHFKLCGANTVFPKPLQLPLLESMWTEYGITGRGFAEDLEESRDGD